METKKQGGKFGELSKRLISMIEKYNTNNEVLQYVLETVYNFCYKCECIIKLFFSK